VKAKLIQEQGEKTYALIFDKGEARIEPDKGVNR
jgi:hypothetical protein